MSKRQNQHIKHAHQINIKYPDFRLFSCQISVFARDWRNLTGPIFIGICPKQSLPISLERVPGNLNRLCLYLYF